MTDGVSTICGKIAFAARAFLLEFHDNNVNACRNLQLLQSFLGLLSRTDYVDQTLVGAALELLTAVLVLVSCTQDRMISLSVGSGIGPDT